jgi:hypothetical protein
VASARIGGERNRRPVTVGVMDLPVLIIFVIAIFLIVALIWRESAGRR